MHVGITTLVTIAGGRKAALEKLYRSHAPILLRYGSKFSADWQLVEDCLQDLFIDLWQRREQLYGGLRAKLPAGSHAAAGDPPAGAAAETGNQ